MKQIEHFVNMQMFHLSVYVMQKKQKLHFVIKF